ncbi:helix-turn-helix domain-containing protein [Maribacter sp. HTCC2170]|uniref:helix-turn-helix domain-containing protein n=1 Tax=Maribacter sp. (strain HTCC2170 / KCCM 42371) TaxID=313603 RepID=UPI0003115E4F|nr:helix-turn-helix domain-containing protein [Maribacter sp. HTCC2170]
MQDIPVNIDFIAIVILLGSFLSIFTSYFLIKKSWSANLPNLFMGLFLLAIGLSMMEGWLNYTNIVFKVLWLTNFSEPTNFIIAPLIFLFVASQFKDFNKRNYWLHFIPFVLWLGYCFFFFIQSNEMKYSSTIEVMQLDYPRVKGTGKIFDDPLNIRPFINIATGISFVIYNMLILRLIFIKSKSLGQTIFNTSNQTLKTIRNSLYHFVIIIIIFIVVKLVFKNDVGDYFIYLYVTFMVFLTVAQIMNKSDYFNEVSTFLEVPSLKYKKSSLDDEEKNVILNNIVSKMENDRFFLKSTASLSGLAKSINESPHHVSQVINENLGQSFFELMATYRVREAQAILNTELGKKITIEEVAERVGYNSKSAFNTAFKKITSQTPSMFRNS